MVGERDILGAQLIRRNEAGTSARHKWINCQADLLAFCVDLWCLFWGAWEAPYHFPRQQKATGGFLLPNRRLLGGEGCFAGCCQRCFSTFGKGALQLAIEVYPNLPWSAFTSSFTVQKLLFCNLMVLKGLPQEPHVWTGAGHFV